MILKCLNLFSLIRSVLWQWENRFAEYHSVNSEHSNTYFLMLKTSYDGFGIRIFLLSKNQKIHSIQKNVPFFKNKKCSLDMQTFFDVSALKMMQIEKKINLRWDGTLIKYLIDSFISSEYDAVWWFVIVNICYTLLYMKFFYQNWCACALMY